MLVWKQLIHKMKFHNLETEIHICGNWNCNLGLYESDFFNSWITGSQFGFPLSGISWLRFETTDTACWLFQISTRLFRDMWVCFVAKHQLTFSNSWTGIMKNPTLGFLRRESPTHVFEQLNLNYENPTLAFALSFSGDRYMGFPMSRIAFSRKRKCDFAT